MVDESDNKEDDNHHDCHYDDYHDDDYDDHEKATVEIWLGRPGIRSHR